MKEQNEVRAVINKWDPIGLLPFAPEDEYKHEIMMVSKAMECIHNANGLGEEIEKIFRERFGYTVFNKPLDECKEIARLILENEK